jgi:hypothetical protein
MFPLHPVEEALSENGLLSDQAGVVLPLEYHHEQEDDPGEPEDASDQQRPARERRGVADRYGGVVPIESAFSGSTRGISFLVRIVVGHSSHLIVPARPRAEPISLN